MKNSSPARGKDDVLLIWILGMLAAFGPLSIDMYLPSLPTIADEFAATPSQVQATLSAFFIGMAVGQLVYGPLSDRIGRRPALIGGIAFYVATSGLCALSTSVESLIAFRFLHALGGGAGTVVARAVIRDYFDAEQASRVLSLMVLIMGVAPLLAPLIGGQILVWIGWRAIFGVLTAFGAICLLAVLARLPESNPPERRSGASLGDVFAGFVEILRHPRSLGSILTNGFAFAGMFAYISGTPFVYIRYFGVPPESYGLLFGLNVLGLMAGASANAQLVGRFGAQRMMLFGIAQLVFGGVLLLVLGGSGTFGIVGIIVPLLIYMSALTTVGANATVFATEPFPRRTGATVALLGAAQFLLGAVAGTATGYFHDGTPLPMVAVICICSLAALASYLILVRR